MNITSVGKTLEKAEERIKSLFGSNTEDLESIELIGSDDTMLEFRVNHAYGYFECAYGFDVEGDDPDSDWFGIQSREAHIEFVEEQTECPDCRQIAYEGYVSTPMELEEAMLYRESPEVSQGHTIH